MKTGSKIKANLDMLNGRTGCNPCNTCLAASLFLAGFLSSDEKLVEINMATLTG